MTALQYRFTDLQKLTDDTHAIFDAWIDDASEGDPVSDEALTLLRLKLAVHEWMANLVQHARFAGTPVVSLQVSPLPSGEIECVIEDNSEGFNLESTLEMRQHALHALPERGMGLLMLQACSKSLSYAKASPPPGHVLAFVVADPDDDIFLDVLF